MYANLTNFILNTDSYKLSHFKQYPAGTEAVSSYIESRGGRFDKTVVFGLQAFLKEYLSKPITQDEIDEAEAFTQAHGVPFNSAGWRYILNRHNGYLPVEIKAIPEGTVLPTRNVMLQVENTDPNCAWLTSYLETSLLRAIWYPTTVATLSWTCKQIITDYLEQTGDPAGVEFKLQDFGARGVSSQESAALGGMAHLVNFKGSDTMAGILGARRWYNDMMAGFSIPASEHSTITAWGERGERAAFENMLTQFGGAGALIACVSDSYDIWRAVSQYWGEDLKDKVETMGGTLVVRPDSGNPPDVVVEVIDRLMNAYGYETNDKGYKVLPSCVRVIQGDGIDVDSLGEILENMKVNEQSADNIVFGMGGGLLQQVNRDTCKFAMKANAVKINGLWNDVWKKPVTDSGKASKAGRLGLIHEDGEWKTVRQEQASCGANYLETVYRDGRLLKTTTFQEVRDRANGKVGESMIAAAA